MAEIATVARPYAEALFRVAQAGDLSAWSEVVSEMAQAASHPDVRALAQNPNIHDQQVADIFAKLLKSPVTNEVVNFIQILVKNNRITLMPEIGAQFKALKNAHEGAADAVITSAFEMNDVQLQPVMAALEKKFGRKLNPSVQIDASLIGGMRVVVGDQVFDTSVRAKLQRMQIALAA
jgi:F-type H+-transporting ATPase subunit delta